MENKVPEKKKRKDSFRWAGFGVEFCGVIGVFCYFGYKLDEYFKTSPWLTVSGFFLGFIGMTYILIKDTKDIWQNKKNDPNKSENK